jgi:hypothetical protein
MVIPILELGGRPIATLHREHGQLISDATEPTLTGYRITITCACDVTFIRHVTVGEAMVDLAVLARRN